MPSRFRIAITITSARCRSPARHFPKAHVLMTELSYFIVERVLHNSVNVMMRQRDELGIREYPLYTHDEVDDLAPQFQGFKYNREIEWAAFHKSRAGLPSPTLEFFDAGHTLGSAGILIRGRKETLFYTRRCLLPRPDDSARGAV